MLFLPMEQSVSDATLEYIGQAHAALLEFRAALGECEQHRARVYQRYAEARTVIEEQYQQQMHELGQEG